MWGAKLVFVLLTCIYPDPVAESWSLFGPSNESTCGINATCDEEGARGVFSRPGFLDRFAQKVSTGEWGWMMKFAWNLFGQIFLQGIVWCGTLCDFVGVAASWSYWLMVGVVAVFILQLGVWTVTWILLPVAQHSYALVQYLRGRAPWHEVASLHGLSTFRPSWVGPRAGTEWTSAYVHSFSRMFVGEEKLESRTTCWWRTGLRWPDCVMERWEGGPIEMDLSANVRGSTPPPTGISGTNSNLRGAPFTFAQKIPVELPKRKGGTFLQAPSFHGCKPTTCRRQPAKALGAGVWWPRDSGDAEDAVASLGFSRRQPGWHEKPLDVAAGLEEVLVVPRRLPRGTKTQKLSPKQRLGRSAKRNEWPCSPTDMWSLWVWSPAKTFAKGQVCESCPATFRTVVEKSWIRKGRTTSSTHAITTELSMRIMRIRRPVWWKVVGLSRRSPEEVCASASYTQPRKRRSGRILEPIGRRSHRGTLWKQSIQTDSPQAKGKSPRRVSRPGPGPRTWR